MIFGHCKFIQEGESSLFYFFDRRLNGYMIAGTFIAPNAAAKMSFAKLWKYFVSEIVRADDIYCSVPLGISNSMFDKYLEPHSEDNGFTIYKVDNFLKNQYSNFVKQQESAKGFQL